MAAWNPRVNQIFVRAIEADSPTERLALLESAFAAEPDLRTPVEALLRAHDAAGSFLGSSPSVTVEPASPTIQMARPSAEAPGTSIGPFKLLQEIGAGGMGTVYMADQEKPVRRRVALKVIKAGMDTNQVVARFEAERHPSCSPGSATGSGSSRSSITRQKSAR